MLTKQNPGLQQAYSDLAEAIRRRKAHRDAIDTANRTAAEMRERIPQLEHRLKHLALQIPVARKNSLMGIAPRDQWDAMEQEKHDVQARLAESRDALKYAESAMVTSGTINQAGMAEAAVGEARVAVGWHLAEPHMQALRDDVKLRARMAECFGRWCAGQHIGQTGARSPITGLWIDFITSLFDAENLPAWEDAAAAADRVAEEIMRHGEQEAA